MNYQNGKIYAIRTYQTEEIYIGSTCSPLYKRLYKHKHSLKRWKKGKAGYTTSYKILEYGDAYIELIENYPCNSKEELRRREGEEIRSCECVNKRIPGRTKKELYEDNKEEILKQKKKYYETHKQKIIKHKKKYYEENKEEARKYYEEHKKEIEEKGKKKMTCECGSIIRRDCKARHERTKKHINFMNNNI
jgi:hypothetical protein